jgi:aerobic carbon-monoxide dehydrogenase medium subunit
MIPAAFDYAAPTSLDEAISLLQQHGDEAKVLAGGHSLLPLMKLRLAAPSLLVDIGRIGALNFIREDGNTIAIGALTPYVALEDSDLLRRRVPLLAQAAGMVGDQQVRNRGTLGGAVAHADPAGDMPAVVTALGGTIVAVGPNGERTIPAGEFFQDVFTSALSPEEIVTEIRISASESAGQNYQKFRRRSIDWAIVGAAVSVNRSNGSIGDASVVLTNVGPTPMRAAAVEQALTGQPATADAVRQAAEQASEGLDPSAELYASRDYKLHLARVITRRALEAALGL